jgi:hypothetical protein
MYFGNIEKGTGVLHKCIIKPDPVKELCKAKRKIFLSSEHKLHNTLGQN